MTIGELFVALVFALILADGLITRSQRNEARQQRDFFKQEVADQTKRAEEAEVKAMQADDRLEVTDRQMVELVEAVTPLIEKSDWMTGRWHGQFSTLVDLENQRNARVDTARRALWKIPVVADATRTVPLLPSLNLLGKTVEDPATAEKDA